MYLKGKNKLQNRRYMGKPCKYYHVQEKHYNAHNLNMLEGRFAPLFHRYAFGKKMFAEKSNFGHESLYRGLGLLSDSTDRVCIKDLCLVSCTIGL